MRGRAPTLLWLRLPIQILFVGLTWWATQVLVRSTGSDWRTYARHTFGRGGGPSRSAEPILLGLP